MKDFIKYTLATIVGVILCTVVLSIIGVVSLAGIAATSDVETTVKEHSLFKLELSGIINERLAENPLASLMGDEQSAMGLEDILTAIDKAASNELIDGIYLEAGIVSGSIPTLTEIREALLKFKQTGKYIIAFGDVYSQGSYYVCSVADKVILHPQGVLDWHGMAAQPTFYKDLLSMVGVEMQVFKVGTYKSAVEPFIATEMSEANREQVSAYLHSLWGNIVKGVSLSRNLTPEQLNQYADLNLAASTAQEVLTYGLVDTLLYMDEVKTFLKEKMGVEEKEKLAILSLDEVKNIRKNVPMDKSGNLLAIYYAEGEIVDASSNYSFGAQPEIVGEKVCKDLRELRDDESIKAVVFRVNSPGGSAFASEKIWKEVVALKEKKPVIVSMGDYAASGGYYISCAADTIVAQPTTLTGSIGIFGMIPNTEKLMTEKLKLHFDMVKTNALSDFGVTTRPFTAEEKTKMQRIINNGYELFVKRCADGRGMTPDAIKAIAEGRVWTGEMALQNGLVDLLGDIETAKRIAAEKAGIESYTLVSYPAQENFLTALLNQGKDSYLESKVKDIFGPFYEEATFLRSLQGKNRVQARMPYQLNLMN